MVLPLSTDPLINCLCADILSGIRQILVDRLVGLYVYGSLVSGDFDNEISDVDLLAVIADDLTDAEFRALDELHHRLGESYPSWRGRIEIGYISARALQTFRSESSVIAIISPGEPFHFREANRDWLVNWAVVREQGRTLYGPSPKTLIDPITMQEYVDVVRLHIRQWPAWLGEHAERKFQSYAILTLCRALYSVRFGEQVSKRRAAEWAAAEWPEWASLIDDAYCWRAAVDDEKVDHRATIAETRRFIDFALSAAK